MSVFRKRRGQDGADETAEPEVAYADEGDAGDAGNDDLTDGDLTDGDLTDGDVPAVARAARPAGPYDESEVDDPGAGGARVDLGGLWLPGRPGLEVRVEADQETGQVVAVTLVLGDGAMQVQPFAAPRSEGIWDGVRAEIRAGITQQGGTVDEVDGPLGPELRTRVPVRAADGGQGVQPARFVGVDGPRWFLRGVITGRPAVEPDTDAELVALFRDIVVVRGAGPMAPRDPIPLTLPAVPDEPGSAAAGPQSSDELKPFERGPEITEIR